eukprot:m.75915 g.75915  ORF g.75915 m.75915 type:complete len:295 (+) comp35963_c0_seq7:57-941(+)
MHQVVAAVVLTIVCATTLTSKAANTGDITSARLVGGEHPSEGFLEVKAGGQWLRVSVYNWGIKSATVACRQLGFIGVGKTKTLNRSSRRKQTNKSGQWRKYLQCHGTEANLSKCPSATLRIIYGYRYPYDVRTTCRNESRPISVRIAPKTITNSTYLQSGLLEVNVNGKWGRVCTATSVAWRFRLARVACRQLDFTDAERFSYHSFTPATKKDIFAGDLFCSGNEKTIDKCLGAFGNQSCSRSAYEGIVCSQSIPQCSLSRMSLSKIKLYRRRRKTISESSVGGHSPRRRIASN